MENLVDSTILNQCPWDVPEVIFLQNSPEIYFITNYELLYKEEQSNECDGQENAFLYSWNKETDLTLLKTDLPGNVVISPNGDLMAWTEEKFVFIDYIKKGTDTETHFIFIK